LHRLQVYNCTVNLLTCLTINSLTGSVRKNEEAKITSYHSVTKNTLAKCSIFGGAMFDCFPEKNEYVLSQSDRRSKNRCQNLTYRCIWCGFDRASSL